MATKRPSKRVIDERLDAVAFESMTKPEMEWLMAAYGHRLSRKDRECIAARLDGLSWSEVGRVIYEGPVAAKRWARDVANDLRAFAAQELPPEPRFSKHTATRLLVAIDVLLGA